MLIAVVVVILMSTDNAGVGDADAHADADADAHSAGRAQDAGENQTGWLITTPRNPSLVGIG